MRVKMRATVSGTRDGVEWPARGEVAELPDAEAMDYIAAGICEPAPDLGAAETATLPEGEARARRASSEGKSPEPSPLTTETGPTPRAGRRQS